ncbi:unnamed protein product [Prorocentrum cordatum]|uniref:dTMP kinase n=1 Tax=Prorocentrum cordatum TaxID=2364126 RepID=A0ABN9W818_9DINO|nr:unnamed protein product [Polarella glacialis]
MIAAAAFRLHAPAGTRPTAWPLPSACRGGPAGAVLLGAPRALLSGRRCGAAGAVLGLCAATRAALARGRARGGARRGPAWTWGRTSATSVLAQVGEAAPAPSSSAAVQEILRVAGELQAAGTWRPDCKGGGGAAEYLAEHLALGREPAAPWPTCGSRGLFVVFEGLDRSGKSTHSKLLAEHLGSEAPVRWMCFPDRSSPIGSLLDLYLRKQASLSISAVHLLFSANRWEQAASIAEDLNSGTHVICDRYAFSGAAYSIANGLDLGFCQAPDRGLPAPDLVCFMRVCPEEAAQREDYGLSRYEYPEMQAKVGKAFDLPGLRAGVAWHDFDSRRSQEVNQAEVRDAARQALARSGPGTAPPLRQLWAD